MMLEDLGTFLASSGVGTLGTNLFLAHMPDEPDDCTCLYEYSGGAPEQRMGNDDAPAYERMSLQVVCRGTAYATVRTRAQTAYDALQRVANESLSGTRYLRVEPLQSPFAMGRDQTSRVLIACNYRVVR